MSPYFVDENVYLVTFFGKNGATPIVKKILDFRDTGDFDEYNLAAEFTID